MHVHVKNRSHVITKPNDGQKLDLPFRVPRKELERLSNAFYCVFLFSALSPSCQTVLVFYYYQFIDQTTTGVMLWLSITVRSQMWLSIKDANGVERTRPLNANEQLMDRTLQGLCTPLTVTVRSQILKGETLPLLIISSVLCRRSSGKAIHS